VTRVFSFVGLGCLGLLLGSISGCNKTTSADPLPNLEVAATLRKGGAGGGAEAGPVSTGTGWGTIKGRFVYAGDPPKLEPLVMTKDKEMCGGGGTRPDESLVVGSDKGIANVVLYVNKASRVFKPEDGSEPAAATPAVFDQDKCIFLSHVLAVPTQEVLDIKNSDKVAHNTSFNPGGRNNSTNPQLPPGGEAKYKWQQAMGTPAEVTCSIHPWMKGYIIARDDPYYAVTKPDGTFEIKNVPAGEDLEFRVWHERAPGGGLEAKPEWKKGRFKIKVPADGVEDLGEIAVPPTAFR